MAHKLVITPFAHTDEDEVYEWYGAQCTGLGEELLKELEITYQKIYNNPEHYALLMKEKNSEIF